MANVPITSLPEATSPSANDYLILQGESTQKIKWSVLLDKLYPVGCIYHSASSTSPASFLGGTWERIKDTFILAAGDTYAAGSTGGEAAHVLIAKELPVNAYNGTFKSYGNVQFFNADSHGSSWTNDYEFMIAAKRGLAGTTGTDNVLTQDNLATSNPISVSNPNGGNSHNNMPPYTAMYVWKRIV